MERSSDKRRRIDSYRLDAKIGEGGMGEIFRAWDESLDRSVALKLISAQRLDNPQARQRFRREAKIAAGLSHPAIVQIHRLLETEAEDAGALDCLVMELVEGRTLRELMAGGRLPLAQLLPIWRQIAEGLAYAHAKGVIHRDLKVDNVMVTPLGRAKILDFGLAKRIAGPMTSLTREGGLLGTLYAMAPEQARGKTVDARSDLFSLGVLFYETLFDSRPFLGDNAHELWLNVMLNPHLPASGRDPAVPAALAALIDRLLEKDPAARPQSAGEVLAVLDLFLPTASLASAAEPPAALPHPSGVATLAISPAAAPPSLARWLKLFALSVLAFVLAGLPPGAGGEPPYLALVADLEALPPEGLALAGLLAERMMASEDLPPLLPPSWTFDAPPPSAESLGARSGVVRVENGSAGLRLVLLRDRAGATVELGSGELPARLELASAALRRFFGRPPEPAGTRLELRSLLPAKPAAALRYGEARAWIFARRADRARILLREGEPGGFSPWRLASAEAAWQWGDVDEAARLLETVDFEVYPRALRRRYRATAFEMIYDLESAAAIYRGLTPDTSADLGLLTRSVFLAGREDRSFELRRARGRQLAAGDRVAAWVIYREMGSLIRREQYEQALQAGQRAVALAAAGGGGKSLQAGLSFALATAHSRLERHGNALEAYRQARRLFDLPRDKAQCLAGEAVARVHLKQLEAAQADFAELELLYRDLGDGASASSAKANLATALSTEGYWEEAENFFREAIAEQQREGTAAAGELGQTLISFGVAFLEVGQPLDAAEQYREAIAIFRRLESPQLLIIALRNQGEVDALRGDPAAAREHFAAAMSEARRPEMPAAAVEEGLIQQAEVELWYGETARAETLLAEARSLAQEELAARLDLATGLLELKKENFSRATELATAVAGAEKGADGETLFQARILMAKIPLSRAKAGPADHRTALDFVRDALETARASRNRRHLAQARILECVAQAKLGQATAVPRLARLEQELAARGFVLFAREAAEWLRELSPGRSGRQAVQRRKGP